MSAKADALYQLLPAVYRIRDADLGKPLYALVSVIADQVSVLEENLEQLHDDQFVETAAPWALPYIGDLIGLEGVNGTGFTALRPRAEVANTISYRRRKGTAAMLEQLARDVTGWPARAVEFFQLLATTQYMNHIRLENASMLSIRDGNRLEFLGTAFERVPAHQVATECGSPPTSTRQGVQDLPHNVDVRRVSSIAGRGRYNIPSIGIFVWRLKAQRLSQSPAVPAADGDKLRFRFSPLGVDQPLFSLPVTEDDFTHLADPINVPMRLSRRILADGLADYYGAGKSILIETRAGTTTPVDVAKVCVCDLTDWAHQPKVPFDVAIDPVLGRMTFAADQDDVLVTYHHGFSADMGGGEYERHVPFLSPGVALTPVTSPATITAALVGLAAGANVIELQDSGRYEECPALAPVAPTGGSGSLTIRAADKRSPILVLNDSAGPRDLLLSGGAEDEIVLDGLTIAGGTLRVPNDGTNALGRLTLRHCTIVPGLGMPDPDPANDGLLFVASDPSLVIEIDGTQVTIDSCILGPIRASHDAHVTMTNSIVDASDQSNIAYCAFGSEAPGAPIHVENSTIAGRVNTGAIELASNTIFVATLPAVHDPAWIGPVQAERRQEGCMRFSHAPLGSHLPRQYKCQPTDAANASRVYPAFDSLSYGHPVYGPEYGRLTVRSATEIRRGADDESEMGAFHDLLAPPREALLTTRLNEYLRFGLEVGVFYAD